jgi:hypothetical protein
LISGSSRDRALAIERVRRDDRALQRQEVEMFRDGRDLVGFAVHGELTQPKPLIRRLRADEMKREGAPQRLAVYGDNPLLGESLA